MGDGQQYLSWVGLSDVLRVIEFAMQNPGLEGPVNTCSPNPATNYEFTKALGAALRRPTVMAMPRPVVETVFGEMGREVLLGSQRAVPRKLQEAGFRFHNESLETTLRNEFR